jgi:hypothetical protein
MVPVPNQTVPENPLVSVAHGCHQEETNTINEINTELRLGYPPLSGCGIEIWIRCSAPNTLDEDAQ